MENPEGIRVLEEISMDNENQAFSEEDLAQTKKKKKKTLKERREEALKQYVRERRRVDPFWKIIFLFALIIIGSVLYIETKRSSNLGMDKKNNGKDSPKKIDFDMEYLKSKKILEKINSGRE